MSLPDLTERLSDHIASICLLRAPQEAVGILLTGEQVIELPNHSEKPETGFLIHKEDMLNSISELGIDPFGLSSGDITLWHSHPQGGVGPSRQDMKHKTPGLHHLVVSLTPEPVFSWY